jgi:hypothetical protein
MYFFSVSVAVSGAEEFTSSTMLPQGAATPRNLLEAEEHRVFSEDSCREVFFAEVWPERLSNEVEVLRAEVRPDRLRMVVNVR